MVNGLDVGRSFSHYRIISKIGAGGMGEVYLAEDTKLDRKVAIKFLNEEFSKDADKLGRFVQEAKAASALNHPNILTVYEIDEVNGKNYIATELIDGKTLRDHLSHKESLQLNQILKIGVEVSEALSAAHHAGIIHRDIKPENIMIRKDGYAKVLDFGLAKLLENNIPPVDKEAATRAQVKTEPGIIMGTVNYMSPEQARGKETDGRTDIWSLGCVIYEMVAGKTPFQGETTADRIASIIHKDPAPLSRVAENVPARLEEIVEKCLEKNADERYQSAKDLLVDLRRLKKKMDLESEIDRSYAPADLEMKGTQLSNRTQAFTDAATDSQSLKTTSSAEYIVSKIQRHKKVTALAIATIIVAGIGLAFGLYKFLSNKRPVNQARTIVRLTNSGKVGNATISPDGKYVAYSSFDESGQSSLWVRHVATTSNVQIVPPAGIDVIFGGATFSPDGNYIYYIRTEKNAPGALYQVPVLGGTSKKLLENVRGPIGFSPDGKQFAFIRRNASQGEDALMIVNADGTGEQKLARLMFPDFYLGGVTWSPDGKTIACSMGGFTGGYYRTVAVIQVADGTQKTLTSHRWFNVERVAWLSDGSGVITTAQEQAGSPHQIWQISYPEGEAHTITNDLNTYHNTSLSADSSALVTLLSDTTSNVWVAPTGEWTGARQLTSGKENGGLDGATTWTSDGKIVYRSLAGGNPDIWIMDADGRNQKQLTDDGLYKRFLSVTRDGRYIVFDSHRSGTSQLWRIDIDGSNLKQLTTGIGASAPHSSPDGKWVAYGSFGSSGFIIWKVSIDGGEPVQVTKEFAQSPAVSPDGKLIACYFLEPQTRVTKIALLPVEGDDPVKLFDLPQTADRNQPVRWTPDGRALAYINTRGIVSNIWLQPIDGSPPRQLTDFKTDRIFSFDWSRDGKQLALSRGVVDSDVVLIKDFK